MMTLEDERKYKPTSQVLDFINKNFISIQKNDKTEYTAILTDVLNQFKKKMMLVDKLYNALNDGDIIYAGSTFDNIKVGKPDEFDMNVPLKLPVSYRDEITIENVPNDPGFTKISLQKGWSRLKKHPEWDSKGYKKIDDFVDKEQYLLQDKLLQWMQSVVSRAIESIRAPPSQIPVIITASNKRVEISATSAGPALTLHLKCENIPSTIDIDLVPVIQFNRSPNEGHWPKSPVKGKPAKCEKKTFSAVPKPKRNSNGDIIPNNTAWRLSFHEQEYELLHGTGELKNCLRQIKKLRDNNPHLKCVASYWIKTIFIWENEKPESAELWKKPKGVIFMHMLNRFYDYVLDGIIPFYWDPNHNLLGPAERKLTSIRECLRGIINKINKNVESNPRYIAEILLNTEELERFNKDNVSASGPVSVAGTQKQSNGNGNASDSSVNNNGNISRSMSSTSGASVNSSTDNDKMFAMLKTIQGILSKNELAMENMMSKIQKLNENILDLKSEVKDVKNELTILKLGAKFETTTHSNGVNNLVPLVADLLVPQKINSNLLDF